MARREVHTTDTTPEQPPVIEIPVAGDFERPAEVIQPLEAAEKNDYFDELAFNEEPVTIMLQESQEKNAPRHVPVWVNGRGADVFLNGRWVPATYLPVNVELTVRRKVLETLVRAKPDNVSAGYTEQNGQDPVNKIDRRSFMKYPVTILEDKNPRGRAWLSRVLAER